MAINPIKFCIRCLLIDQSGYVIVHYNWVTATGTRENIHKHVHISSMEPGITKDLIDANIMKDASCLDITDIKKQKYWRVNYINFRVWK